MQSPSEALVTVDDVLKSAKKSFKGERAGEPGASLESTLVHIGLIKIDGTQVYPTSQAQAEAPQAEDAPAPEAEVAADTAADQPVEPAVREPAGEVEEQEPALAASF